MSKIGFSGKLVPFFGLAAAMPLAAVVGCGGASGSATVQADANLGVSANANVSADVGVNADVGVGVTTTTTTVVGTTCIEEWVHMPVLINFPTGGAVVDVQSRAILDELVRSAQTRTDLRAVRVEGHTDRCGHEANNMALSQQRADSVAAELVTMGVPREQIMTVGYGDQQPRANDACDRAHELSRATNRRVEFSLLVCRQ